MVYSGGVRSVIQVAALCALALSPLPSIQAKKTPTPAPTLCSVSDGNKSAGIQVINDDSCVKGGLGCFDKHCRYCKVLDTPKSKHLDTCLSYGVAFTSTTPVAVTEGPCKVSSGDVAAGISVVKDSGCLYGGLGCYSDHCRFCKVVETPQSAGFMVCSSLDKSYSAPVATTAAPTAAPTATDAPVTSVPVVVIVTEAPTLIVDVPDLTPTVVATDPPITTESPSISTVAPVAESTCTVVPSVGDIDAGVNIVTDLSCAPGGLGCLSDVCRFCKVKTTTRSDAYMDCALVNGQPTTTTAPDATTVTPSVTSATEPETPVTTTPVVPDATTEAPVDVTDVPVSTTAAPDVTTETETPVTTTPVVPDATTEAPVVVTDVPTSTTATPDVTTETPASTIEAPYISTETPDATTATPTTVPGATTEAPIDVTDVPVSTTANPVDTTEVPVVSTDSLVVTTEAPASTMEAPAVTETPAPATTCTLVASDEDAEFGISVATDPSCSLGGVGCIDEICRFCKITTSLQSAGYLDCASLNQPETPATDSPSEVPSETPGATTETPTATTETPVIAVDAPAETPVVTETPVVDTPVSTSSVLPAQDTCGIQAAAGDIAVGVHIATDATCSAGGTGCINSLCRFCKVETTPQSEAFVDCFSLAGYSVAPVDVTTAIPVATIPVLPASCDLVASTGDAAVGIRIVTDATCSVGGVGCINDVCRFCKVITSIQSADFIDCVTVNGYTSEPATTTPGVTTTAPASEETCTQIASEGDVAVGVDVTTDTTCSSGGVGCIDNLCRFCQVTNTAQSEAFVSCTSLSAYTPRSESPVDVTTTTGSVTDAPVAQASCDLVVSAGDAAVGISITGDAMCAAGGVGCIDSNCRFCKVTTTVQSAAFVDCTSIAGFTLASDVTADSITPPTVSSTSTAATSATCGVVVSEGDAGVGIDITADSTCQFGGVGCIDNVCRFCKLRTTEQSAAFVDCPATANPAISTPAPSNTTSSASSLPADASEPPVDTTSTDVPQTTPAASDATDVATEAPAVTVANADNSDVSTEAPSIAADAEEPTDVVDTTDVTGNAETEVPSTAVDSPADASDVPQVHTSDTDDSTVKGSNDTTEAPAANLTDDSDLLTEAPATASKEPTKAPTPTVDDSGDNWEGSDEASEADSDSTYYDSDESLEGI